MNYGIWIRTKNHSEKQIEKAHSKLIKEMFRIIDHWDPENKMLTCFELYMTEILRRFQPTSNWSASNLSLIATYNQDKLSHTFEPKRSFFPLE